MKHSNVKAALLALTLAATALLFPQLANAESDTEQQETTAPERPIIRHPWGRQPSPPSLPAPLPTTTQPTTTQPPATEAPTTQAPSPEPPSDTPLVWGEDNTVPSASWSRPSVYSPYNDPAYGLSVQRITSADGTRFNRNTYSRRQAENANGSMFLTYHGDAEYRVYNQADGSRVPAVALHPGSEPQWHPTDPDVIRHLSGDNAYTGSLKYFETNVATGSQSEIADLSDRVQARYPSAQYMQDRDEGSPSADGNRVAWILYDGSEDPIAIIHYDLSSDRILGFADLLTAYGRLDWVSSSPSGSYVVTGYVDATFSYDADLSNARQLDNEAAHSDIAIGANGNDTYVYQDFSAGPDGGWLMAVDLPTLQRTRLFDLYSTDANTSIHISGKGYNKPGWVVVSTYSCKQPGGAWSCHKVMAVELSGENRILNLAHTYNCGEDYWTETHAVVNRDFTRVYFNSDSGSCGIDAEVFQITLPRFN